MGEQYKTDALIRRSAKEAGLRVEIRHKDWPANGITEATLHAPGTAYRTILTIYDDQTEEQIEASVASAIDRLLRDTQKGGG